jgi:pullulanase
VSDILARRENHFVLWCPAPPANPPDGAIEGLWHLKAGTLALAEGKTYHYWFEVDNTLTGHAGRVQTTDPFAFSVDYRLYPLANPSIVHPASVMGWAGGKLVPNDPNGEREAAVVAPFEKLASNNQMVIYELPTAWSVTR